MHFAETERHKLPDSPKFADFHFMLQSRDGWECVKNFIMNDNGEQPLVENCFLFLQYINELKRHLTTSKTYKEHVYTIWELFIMEHCEKPLYKDKDTTGLSRMSSLLGGYEKRDGAEDEMKKAIKNIKLKVESLIFSDCDLEDMFYTPVDADGTTLSMLFGRGRRRYMIWTEKNVFLPSDFDEVEYLAFKRIFNFYMKKKSNFEASEYFRRYQAKLEKDGQEHERKMEMDYIRARRQGFLEWTREFMKHEAFMFWKAGDVVDAFIKQEAKRRLEEAILEVREEEVLRLQRIEQEAHESQSMKIDDAVSWVTVTIWDEIFAYYVPPLIDSMLVDDKRPYVRTALLNYAEMNLGLGGGGSIKVDLHAKNEAKELFDSLFS